MESFLLVYNFFGVFLSVMLGVGQLIQKENRYKILIALLFFCLSFLIFYFSMIDSLWIYKAPYLLFFNIPFHYLISPLLFLYVTIITTRDFKWKNVYILHFLPTLVSIFLIIPLALKSRNEKIHFLNAIILKGDFSAANIIIIVPTAMIFLYLVYLAWINNPFINFRDKKIIFINIILVLWTAATITGGFTFIKGDIHFVRYVVIFLNLSLIAIFIIQQYDPALMSHVTEEIREKKYENSHLNKVDLKILEENIIMLFEEKKIYRKNNLTLKKCARKLEITPHQLSEFINEHKKSNFNGYINSYRVSEAAEILIENSERNVLEIAYEVGFNSVSSFHEAFKKSFGVSPAEYRKTRSPAF